MSKHQLQNKVRSINRVASSISVDPEAPNQIQEQVGSSQPVSGFVPAYEEIQRRAYQIHEERGGSDFDNWLEAEQALKEERHAGH